MEKRRRLDDSLRDYEREVVPSLTAGMFPRRAERKVVHGNCEANNRREEKGRRLTLWHSEFENISDDDYEMEEFEEPQAPFRVAPAPRTFKIVKGSKTTFVPSVEEMVRHENFKPHLINFLRKEREEMQVQENHAKSVGCKKLWLKKYSYS